MNAQQHKELAEAHIGDAVECGPGSPAQLRHLTFAQVHATLATVPDPELPPLVLATNVYAEADPAPDLADRLLAYSEWLDSSDFIRGPEENGDERTNEQLVDAFLARRARSTS